jgi:hypothetical protein
MEEYPKNVAEFEAWFSSEQACRDYLFHVRWPTGFRCPLSSVGNRRNDFSGHAQTVDGLVSCDMAGNRTKKWGESSRPETYPWPWKSISDFECLNLLEHLHNF